MYGPKLLSFQKVQKNRVQMARKGSFLLPGTLFHVARHLPG